MAAQPSDLHTLAVDAQHSVEQLATGLGQAQADPGAIKAVSNMAGVLGKIVKVLGSGQAAQPAQAAPAQDAQPAPAGPQTMDSATAALHHSAQAAAHARDAAQQQPGYR
jgi:hypothetical protein